MKVLQLPSVKMKSTTKWRKVILVIWRILICIIYSGTEYQSGKQDEMWALAFVILCTVEAFTNSSQAGWLCFLKYLDDGVIKIQPG